MLLNSRNFVCCKQKSIFLRNLSFTLILVFSTFVLQAQDKKLLRALNYYVDFTNETTHGLLIIHRLLENYNQEVNKYVDLPGYKINNIRNKDLPSNIFKDEEHWFYPTTPYEWYEKLKSDKKTIGIKYYNSLFPLAKSLFKTSNQINNIRFKIADLISSHELTKQDNLNAIYNELDKAVDLFDLYYAYLLNLEHELKFVYPDRLVSERDKSLFSLYNKSIDLLKALRVKNRAKIKMENGLLNLKLNKHRKYNPYSTKQKCNNLNNRIISSISSILPLAYEIELSPNVAKEYKLYGKHYYYYNVKLIDKYNRYGNGFILYFNDLIECLGINALKRFELPHYFKVIKPKKKINNIDWIRAKKDKITSIPRILDGRETKYNAIHTIEVDNYDIELELFDFKIQDGDIVSINFNGDWIFRNLSLETKPKKLKLKLNNTGKNYIILHAENVGRRPPNTIGIRYKYKDESKTMVLESDLKTSDLVQFIIKDNN